MPSAPEIVAEIKIFLTSRQHKTPRELEDLARSYASMCSDANDRLKRCADFLRSGLRSEAIYHAEIPPDLLDLVTALDLPQFREWDAFCVEQDLERPQPLLLEIAQELNRAYAVEQSVRDLLKQLRLESLARAPLRSRLALLRSLAGLDPGNEHLERDVRDYEAARISEIRGEADEAFEARDLDRLRRLAAELSDDEWCNPVSPDLVESVKRRARHVQLEQAVKQLHSLVNPLHTAHGALAYEEAKALLGRWDQIVAGASMRVSPALRAQIEPVVGWVSGIDEEREQEHAFLTACSALQQALVEKTSIADLQRLHTQVTSFDRPVAPDLEQAYRVGRSELQLRQRRQRRVLLAAAGVTAVAVGVGATFLVRHGLFKARVGRVEQQILLALQDYNLSGAREYLEGIRQEDPAVAGHPTIMAAIEDLRRAETYEDDRARQFRAYMKQARGAGVDTPDYQALKLAGELARTQEERLEQEAFKGRCDTAARERQAERDRVFSGKITALAQRFSAIERDLVNDTPAVFLAQLKPIMDDALDLQDAKGESPGLMGTLASLTRRMDADRQAAQRIHQQQEAERRRREQQQRDLDGLALHAHSPAALATALKKYAADYPTAPRAAAFTRAAPQENDWAAVVVWPSILKRWQFQAEPKQATEISERIDAVDAYVQRYPDSPLREPVTAYLDYLRRSEAAMAPDGPWRQELTDFMNAPIMQLNSFKTTAAKRYYVPKNTQVQERGAGFTVPVIRSKNDLKGTAKFFAANTITELPKPSPQAKLAVAAVGKLVDLNVRTWDTFGFEVAQMVRDEVGIDPVLKVIVLKMVLSCMKQSGWGAEDEVAAELDRLGRISVDDVRWMDPDDATAALQRVPVIEALKKMPSFAALREKVERKREGLFRAAAARSTPCGVMLKVGETWQMRTVQHPLPDGHTLWAVTAPLNPNDRALRQVGVVRDGKAVIDAAVVPGLIEGTMAFIRRPAAQ